MIVNIVVYKQCKCTKNLLNQYQYIWFKMLFLITVNPVCVLFRCELLTHNKYTTPVIRRTYGQMEDVDHYVRTAAEC